MKDKTAREIIKSKRPKKAGVLLFETSEDGSRKFLVPYNEGRFAKNGRYFVLPKGSVEYAPEASEAKLPEARNDNAPLQAIHYDTSAIAGGIRETAEETGFPLDTFLGPENIRKLEQGRKLKNITNPDFPGFEILEACPKAYPHTYVSRSNHEQTMVMYGFKVRGLESLMALKNSAGKTTKEYLDERPEMPRFPTFLQWMKQGYIPAHGDLPEVPLFDKPGWFNRKVAQIAPEGIEVEGDSQATRAKWQQFCCTLEQKQYDKEYDKFRDCFARIKDRLKTEGYIGGDLDVLKFDEKDCPLFYYTEGATIDTEQNIIRKTLTDMMNNPDYARAFGGKGTLKQGLSDGETMVLGQVAAWSSFVKPSIWRAALMETMGATGKIADKMIKHGQRIRENAGTMVMQTQQQASAQIAR